MAKDIVISIFGNIPAVQRKIQVELSETEIVYRDGPLVELGRPPKRAGRADVGGRARDAEMIDAATSESVNLWPRLCGTHHTLMLFEDAPDSARPDEAIAAAGDRLKVLRLNRATDPRGQVRERFHHRAPGWVLVRPDQVVAARGEGADYGVLREYASRVLASPGHTRR